MVNGTISQIVIKSNKSNINDTLKFSYSGTNISSITTYNKGIKSKAWLYFNTSGNLDSIITKYGDLNFISLTNYSYSLNESTKKRRKEVFSNYDTYQNPLKNLIIFDETFNRSVSKNNFRSYSEYYYDKNNSQQNSLVRDWTLIYENNRVNFAK